MITDDERVVDEEEFAVSSKPKQLSSDVVRSGMKVEDDFTKLGSLKDRKGDWESSAKDAAEFDKKTVVEEELINAGKVKANLERFVTGAVNENGEEEEDVERDPNIIREGKKGGRKEELNFKQVGEVKNKWKTGDVEGAEVKEISKEDLEELKKGPGLKERFKERTEEEETTTKSWDASELDTSTAASARKSFLEGSAFQSGPVEKSAELSDVEFKKLQSFKEKFEKGVAEGSFEKTAIDLQLEGLGDLKAAFEKIDSTEMKPEERAKLKQKEIEAEFKRYKLARIAAAKREAEEAASADGGPGKGIEVPTEELGSIKDRFEKGEVFSSATGEKSELDVEIKMAGKAREKFKQIEAEAPQNIATPEKQKKASKWDKKEKAAPEVINKRIVEEEPDEPEPEDAYDVKNLMKKFKNIGHDTTAAVPHERHLDLEGIKVEAKNIKDQFEKAVDADEEEKLAERQRKLEEEFARLKEAKEAAAAEAEPEEEQETVAPKEEIHVAADHATKMAAKWEKIQKKEAKKAERSKMPQKAHVDK
ncbi:hypothetical protein AB6A40_004365 [Gnathostoma spinigerum]|uniref:Uncharacterized protein n=1 Tax=Gnathostoma spinigerum TaxID=75299 RepID=A0ABD6EEL3_9BILA